MRAAILTILLLAIVPALAACGGSSGGSTGDATTTTHGPFSKADWIARADAVCREAKEGEGSAHGPALLTKGGELMHQEATELEAIPVPPAETTYVDKLTRAVRSVVGVIDEEHGKVDPNSSEPSSQYELDAVLTAVGGPVTKMDEEFLAYGAKVCGEVRLGFPGR